MVSSNRLIIAAVLLIFSAAVSSFAQTASISGKVKIKDKAVAGVIVFAETQDYRPRYRTNLRGTTDQSGNYRIANVPAGTYTIRPVAPSFALEDYAANNEVVVSEGEALEDINFTMIPGGVITGRVSDADGKPVVEADVSIMPVFEADYVGTRFDDHLRTDDRGIYRAFGLQAGKYKVFVGNRDFVPGGPSSFSYRQTFYPSVTEDAKATVIEVTEGSETANIDIVVGRPITTYKVSGRIFDAETGKPLNHMRFGVFQSYGRGESSGGSSRVGNDFTNVDGEFRLDNVLPGKYAVFVVPEDSGVRGDQVSFEVIDRDVTDLVIKAGKAAIVEGIVVFESGGELKANPKGLTISAWADSAEQPYSHTFGKAVNPDGSFKIPDLRKGRVRFFFSTPTPNDYRKIQLIRVERDGVVQPGGLVLRDGEQVTGVRLVVKFLTGAIHGQIKFDGDELPASRMSVWIKYLDERQGEGFSMSNSSPQLDSRKRFMVDGLPAGTYEVNVAVFDPGRQDSNRIFKQQVTVVDNAASDVLITIKTKP